MCWHLSPWVAEKIYMPNLEPSSWAEMHPHLPNYIPFNSIFHITIPRGQVVLETLQCPEWILLYDITMLLQGHLTVMQPNMAV
jgi:hypothetical protein